MVESTLSLSKAYFKLWVKMSTHVCLCTFGHVCIYVICAYVLVWSMYLCVCVCVKHRREELPGHTFVPVTSHNYVMWDLNDMESHSSMNRINEFSLFLCWVTHIIWICPCLPLFSFELHLRILSSEKFKVCPLTYASY